MRGCTVRLIVILRGGEWSGPSFLLLVVRIYCGIMTVVRRWKYTVLIVARCTFYKRFSRDLFFKGLYIFLFHLFCVLLYIVFFYRYSSNIGDTLITYVFQELEKTRETLSAKKAALDKAWGEIKELKRSLTDVKASKQVEMLRVDPRLTAKVPSIGRTSVEVASCCFLRAEGMGHAWPSQRKTKQPETYLCTTEQTGEMVQVMLVRHDDVPQRSPPFARMKIRFSVFTRVQISNLWHRTVSDPCTTRPENRLKPVRNRAATNAHDMIRGLGS